MVALFKSFMCIGLVGCLGLWGCTNTNEQSSVVHAPDRIFHGGRIYTADGEQATVEAMAIRRDRIVAVGSSESVLALKGDQTKLVDLEGKLLLPGLHDAHIHPVGVIEYESCNLDSTGMDLLALSEFVAGCLDTMKIPAGQWLSVRQWSFGENNLPAGGFNNLREALDGAALNNPVILLGNDGHHNATNSAGLALAKNRAGERVGLTASTLAKYFADIVPFVGLDASGEPNGAINEGAYRVLGAPGIIDADIDLIAEYAPQLTRRLNSLGITSIQDAAAAPVLEKFYDSLLSSGPVSLRIRLAQYFLPEDFMSEDGVFDVEGLLRNAAVTRDKYAKTDNINANALKWFVDGVLEGNPLANPPTLPNAGVLKQLHQPRFEVDIEQQRLSLLGYVDIDSTSCDRWRQRADQAQDAQQFVKDNGFHPGQCLKSSGVMYAPAPITKMFAAAADKAGFAVHFHAIGDRSVRTAVEAIAAITPDDVTINRHSVTHLQLVDDPEIKKLGELKIPVAFTYAWARSSFMYDATVIPFIEKLDSLEDMYDPGSYYYQHFYPAGSIKRAGGILAAGSDAPVETDDPRPFENIEAAVTRDRGEGIFNPEQRLHILDAIDAYTINGAKLLGQHELTGSLEPGKKADFIIVDQDIIELAENGKASEVHKTKVMQTWFDGSVVYQAQ